MQAKLWLGLAQEGGRIGCLAVKVARPPTNKPPDPGRPVVISSSLSPR